MRSDPSDFQLSTPSDLASALSLMASDSDAWLPIAGGTDLMVLYAAGKLSSRKLVSIWNLPELRSIELCSDEILLGAGSTYTDLRSNETVLSEFPLLASAAAWTGGIANQNRGTLGGNIVNASPAADSLPALLVYDAALVIASVQGERELPYRLFHLGYKEHALQSGELIRAIRLPRKFLAHVSFARKVGARRAQAISKVCIAALAKVTGGVIEDARIALGSVAPVPIRLAETERLLVGKRVDPSLAIAARQTVSSQIRPIDDIRSNMAYRSAVAANLVAEFVDELCKEAGMS